MRTPLFFVLFLLLGAHCTAQEFIGPDRTSPGTLALFEIIPAQEASWYIVPSSPNAGRYLNTMYHDTAYQVDTAYQIDTGLSKIYFASPVPGCYTVVAGIVTEGKPLLLVKTFINGTEDAKPTPPASSIEAWIKTQLPVLVKSNHLAAESRLMTDCLGDVLRRIDDGNIKTVPNAQSQLQMALTGRLALASPTAVTDWIPFLSELSRQLEKELGGKINDITEVKKALRQVSDAMKSFELLDGVRTPLPHIDYPDNRGQGTQNRVFRNLLTR